MKHEVLSLDFWQKTTIYGDKNFPCGTIGCDALNVPAKVLDKLGIYCSLLNAFENKTAEIIRLADWDKMNSQPFAKYAISYLLNCQNEKLPKETVISFEE